MIQISDSFEYNTCILYYALIRLCADVEKGNFHTFLQVIPLAPSPFLWSGGQKQLNCMESTLDVSVV